MEIFGHRMRKYIDLGGAKIFNLGTPMPLHGVNPRSMVSSAEWDKMRRDAYQRFDYKCAICGATDLEQGFGHPVEAHEIWDYDFDTCTQYFEGLVALCPICHKVVHGDHNTFLLQDGKISSEEFHRQEALKEEKAREVNGDARATTIKAHPWHLAEWKSDFSKLKELYPYVIMRAYFDTKWNGYFGKDGADDFIYKPIDGPNDVLF